MGVATVEIIQSGYEVVLIGTQGPPGASGAGFVHTQSSAATEWVVNHNLGFEPAVEVIDTGGLAGIGDIVHFSVNQLRIYFAAATAGKARCV